MSDEPPTRLEPQREYLGDSVYAAWLPHKGMIKLYTDNGSGPKNVIFIEGQTFIEFLRFAAKYPRWIPMVP